MNFKSESMLSTEEVRLKLFSIFRCIARYGFTRGVCYTGVTFREFNQYISIALRCNFNLDDLDPHGGRWCIPRLRNISC